MNLWLPRDRVLKSLWENSVQAFCPSKNQEQTGFSEEIPESPFAVDIQINIFTIEGGAVV